MPRVAQIIRLFFFCTFAVSSVYLIVILLSAIANLGDDEIDFSDSNLIEIATTNVAHQQLALKESVVMAKQDDVDIFDDDDIENFQAEQDLIQKERKQ